MATRLLFFIAALRALAAIAITNSHYEGVYPTDLIANGGLVGDVLFFAVSGYCLQEIKLDFRSWYCKRLLRIFPAVWIITLIYQFLGVYKINTPVDYFSFYFWPTKYHFVGSIVLLYMPFFFICKYAKTEKHLKKVISGVFLFQIMLYITVYNYSYYHIDTVREPMIWFLFLEAMLLGAYFRIKVNRQPLNKVHFFYWVGIAGLICIYFISKLSFVHIPKLAPWQIINQIFLLILLFCLFRGFTGLEFYFSTLGKYPKKIITYLADRTLEIYLVQYVIIAEINIGKFPLNWFLITFSILFSAHILHEMSVWITRRINI